MPHDIPRNALVLVADGRRALFLDNRGTALAPDLHCVSVMEHENPPTHEQGTDKPGTTHQSVGAARSSVEQPDLHARAEDRFVETVATALAKRVADKAPPALIVVAAPKAMAVLKTALPATVARRVGAWVTKDLTKHPLPEIARLLAEA